MKKKDDDLPWAGDLIKGIIMLLAFFIYEYFIFHLGFYDDLWNLPFLAALYLGFQLFLLTSIPWLAVLYGGWALLTWLGFIKKPKDDYNLQQKGSMHNSPSRLRDQEPYVYGEDNVSDGGE